MSLELSLWEGLKLGIQLLSGYLPGCFHFLFLLVSVLTSCIFFSKNLKLFIDIYVFYTILSFVLSRPIWWCRSLKNVLVGYLNDFLPSCYSLPLPCQNCKFLCSHFSIWVNSWLSVFFNWTTCHYSKSAGSFQCSTP